MQYFRCLNDKQLFTALEFKNHLGHDFTDAHPTWVERIILWLKEL